MLFSNQHYAALHFGTHVQLSTKLAISPTLDEYAFVDAELDQIKRLLDARHLRPSLAAATRLDWRARARASSSPASSAAVLARWIRGELVGGSEARGGRAIGAMARMARAALLLFFLKFIPLRRSRWLCMAAGRGSWTAPSRGAPTHPPSRRTAARPVEEATTAM